MIISIIFINICYQIFAIGSNVLLSQWSSDPNGSLPGVRNLYLGVYGTFGVLQGTCFNLIHI